MSGLCCCWGGAPDSPRRRDSGVNVEALAGVIRQRTEQITEGILNGPLNQPGLPDFLERRLLNTIVNLIFSVVITVLLQPRDRNALSRI